MYPQQLHRMAGWPLSVATTVWELMAPGPRVTLAATGSPKAEQFGFLQWLTSTPSTWDGTLGVAGRAGRRAGSSMGRQLLPPWRQFLPEALAMNVQRRASKPGHSAQAAG
jgi:hypothetical protein